MTITPSPVSDSITNTNSSTSDVHSLNHAINDANTGYEVTGTFSGNMALQSAASSIPINLTVSGSSLTLDGDGYTLTGTGSYADLTITSGTVTIENLNLANTGGGSALSLASGTGVVFGEGSATNDASATSIGVISAPITGAGNVTDGAAADGAKLAPLILNAANTYTGTTTIYDDVVIGANGSIAGSSAVNLAQSGSTLDLSNAQSSTSPTVGGATTESINNLTGVSGSHIFLGQNSLSVTDSTNTAFSGVISDGDSYTGPIGHQISTLTVNGSGTFEIDSAQAYTGATKIYGHLALGANGDISSSDNVSLKQSGASLTLNTSVDPTYTIHELTGVSGTSVNLNNNQLDVIEDGVSATYAGAITGGSASVFDLEGSSALTLTHFSGSAFSGELEVSCGASMVLSGSSFIDVLGINSASQGTLTGPSSIVDNGNLDVSGISGGTVTVTALSGYSDSASLYIGANNLTVDYNNTSGSVTSSTFDGGISGTGGVQVGEAGALYGFTRGTLTLGGEDTFTGATKIYGHLVLDNYDALEDSKNVSLKVSGASLDVSDDGATIHELTGVSGTSVILGCETLTVTEDVSSATFGGVISGYGGFDLAAAAGSGTNYALTLTAANTYTGDTSVDAGTTLRLGPNGSIADSEDVTVNGALDVSTATGPIVVLNNLEGSGAITLGNNNLEVGLGYGEFESNTTEFDGVISGLGGLATAANNLCGSDTLILGGVNTYEGVTDIGSGTTLVVAVDGAIDDTSQVTINANGWLDFEATDTFTAVIGGSGSLEIGGGKIGGPLVTANEVPVSGPVVTLTAVETYTGETDIGDSATLVLGATASIAQSSLVYVDGVLDVSGVGSGTATNVTLDQLAGGSDGLVNLGANTLEITGSGSCNWFDGSISGTGGVLVDASAVLQLSGGDSTYIGKTVINGELVLADGASLSGTHNVSLKTTGAELLVESGWSDINELTGISGTFIELSGSCATLEVTENGVNASYSGVINGSGNLDIGEGAATLTLFGSEGYTGRTEIDTGGHLVLSGAASLANSWNVEVDGILDVSAVTTSGTTSFDELNGSGSLILGSTNVLDHVNNEVFSGVISGSGSFTAIGETEFVSASNQSSTLLQLSGANTFTGQLVIDGGTVELEGVNSAGSGTISFAGSTGADVGVLQIDNSALTGVGTATESFANTIDFSTMQSSGSSGIIDLAGLAYEGGSQESSLSYNSTSHVLTVTEGNVSVQLHVTGISDASGLAAYEDSHGGTFLVYDNTTQATYDASHFHP